LQSLHAQSDKSKMFLHVQNIQTLKVDNLYFFQMFFFSTCAPFFLKNGEVFNIDEGPKDLNK
jgi:hypothetical protein